MRTGVTEPAVDADDTLRFVTARRLITSGGAIPATCPACVARLSHRQVPGSRFDREGAATSASCGGTGLHIATATTARGAVAYVDFIQRVLRAGAGMADAPRSGRQARQSVVEVAAEVLGVPTRRTAPAPSQRASCRLRVQEGLLRVPRGRYFGLLGLTPEPARGALTGGRGTTMRPNAWRACRHPRPFGVSTAVHRPTWGFGVMCRNLRLDATHQPPGGRRRRKERFRQWGSVQGRGTMGRRSCVLLAIARARRSGHLRVATVNADRNGWTGHLAASVIARDTGQDRATIVRHLAQLKKDGWVESHGVKDPRGALYRLPQHPLPRRTDAPTSADTWRRMRLPWAHGCATGTDRTFRNNNKGNRRCC